MISFRPRRPSPAMVIALIALVVALGGTSYAAFNLPRGSVGTKQIKNGAVTTKKLHRGAVSGASIQSGAVGSSQLDLSGVTVPNAANADHATSADHATNAGEVSGISLTKVFFHGPAGAKSVQVYSADGLVIKAGCDETGNKVAALASGSDLKNEGRLAFHVFSGFAAPFAEEAEPLETSVHGLTDSRERGSGGLTYSTPNGQVVTMEYGFSSNNFGDGGCTFSGIASASN
jgi:hypothetical protein